MVDEKPVFFWYLDKTMPSIYSKMSESEVQLDTPEKREGTFSNIFSYVTLPWVLGYICFNFYIEWNNWDKLKEEADAHNSTPPKPSNITISNSTWESYFKIDVNENLEMQIIRMNEVCENIEIFNIIFVLLLVVVPFASIIRYICRQGDIFKAACKCDNSCMWCIGLIVSLGMTAFEALLSFVIITMLLPSTFMYCYSVVAQYYCTLLFSGVVLFIIHWIFLVAINNAVLKYKIQYNSLGLVGRNNSIDKVHGRRKTPYKDKQGYSDEVDEVEITVSNEKKKKKRKKKRNPSYEESITSESSADDIDEDTI